MVMIYPDQKPVLVIAAGSHKGWLETQYGRHSFVDNDFINGDNLVVERIYLER